MGKHDRQSSSSGVTLEQLNTVLEAQTVKLTNEFKKELADVKQAIGYAQDLATENKKDILALETRIAALEKQADESSQSSNNSLRQLNKAIDALHAKQVDMDIYSRRSALHFANIPEAEGEICEDVIREFIRTKLNVDPTEMRFERVHRIPLGPKKNFKYTRTITAKFNWFQDLERVWNKRFTLKDVPGRYIISESLPYEVETNRKILYPIFKKAKAMNMRASLFADNLILEGVKFRVDTLHTLPAAFAPFDNTYIKNDDLMLYNSDTSPLGPNFYSSFSENGVIFKSLTQYIAFQKAIAFDNVKIAESILTAKNPQDCRRIIRGLDMGANVGKWPDCLKEFLTKGNRLKFTQNEQLKAALMTTGSNKLGECNPFDPLSGNGLRLNDPASTDTTKWTGQNLGGLSLMAVRDELGKP
ncbi:unnamed protein product [Owenia fusiformis]|uniref:Uncharacterized protein n=1 Tax=Owenia fusiformis TaxID=6347 RepID=A0A8J1TIU7_OWEFU|nr:unnamed protein product [Owenia fusiformis]